jgi:hypothetical protein
LRLNQSQKPLVTGRGLDDYFKGTKLIKELDNPQFIIAAESPDVSTVSRLADNADADSLFMEVDAYVIHGILLLWKPRDQTAPHRLPRV